MQNVYVLSSGQIPVAKYSDSSPANLGALAIEEALKNAELEPKDMGALYAGNMMSGQLSHQLLMATLLANQSGMTGCEAITAEAA